MKVIQPVPFHNFMLFVVLSLFAGGSPKIDFKKRWLDGFNLFKTMLNSITVIERLSPIYHCALPPKSLQTVALYRVKLLWIQGVWKGQGRTLKLKIRNFCLRVSPEDPFNKKLLKIGINRAKNIKSIFIRIYLQNHLTQTICKKAYICINTV